MYYTQAHSTQQESGHAGYRSINLDSFRKQALALLSDPHATKRLLNNREFTHILSRQQKCVVFDTDIDLKHLMKTEAKEKGARIVENDFIVDIVTLALTEMDQSHSFSSAMAIQQRRSREEIEETMTKV